MILKEFWKNSWLWKNFKIIWSNQCPMKSRCSVKEHLGLLCFLRPPELGPPFLISNAGHRLLPKTLPTPRHEHKPGEHQHRPQGGAVQCPICFPAGWAWWAPPQSARKLESKDTRKGVLQGKEDTGPLNLPLLGCMRPVKEDDDDNSRCNFLVVPVHTHQPCARTHSSICSQTETRGTTAGSGETLLHHVSFPLLTLRFPLPRLSLKGTCTVLPKDAVRAKRMAARAPKSTWKHSSRDIYKCRPEQHQLSRVFPLFTLRSEN